MGVPVCLRVSALITLLLPFLLSLCARVRECVGVFTRVFGCVCVCVVYLCASPPPASGQGRGDCPPDGHRDGRGARGPASLENRSAGPRHWPCIRAPDPIRNRQFGGCPTFYYNCVKLLCGYLSCFNFMIKFFSPGPDTGHCKHPLGGARKCRKANNDGSQWRGRGEERLRESQRYFRGSSDERVSRVMQKPKRRGQLPKTGAKSKA